MNYLITFLGVLGSVWMLAIAMKIVEDTWDALFSEDYKEWLKKFREKSKTHLKNRIEIKLDKNGLEIGAKKENKRRVEE